MNAIQSPEHDSVLGGGYIESLRAAFAEVCSNLDRVWGLKAKLETVAANTDKSLLETQVQHRAAALDKLIEDYESRKFQLGEQIERASTHGSPAQQNGAPYFTHDDCNSRTLRSFMRIYFVRTTPL